MACLQCGYLCRSDNEPSLVVQIVGMSATLPNLSVLATWLNAQLYLTNYRPIPLTEMVKIGSDIFDCGLTKLRRLPEELKVKGDEDMVIPLCLETVRGGHGVLVFCPTKNWCEQLADSIAREAYNIMSTACMEKREGGEDAHLPNLVFKSWKVRFHRILFLMVPLAISLQSFR